MAYIYQITNDINDKVYIGKTEASIQRRFSEHCRDAFRVEKEKRPLYSAMRKYGIEHFKIELIEETDNPTEREKYWIALKGTYHYGYNATLGGDGSKLIEDKLVIEAYSRLQNQQKVAEELKINVDTIHKILVNNKIEIIIPKLGGKEVYVYNIDNKYLQSFETLGDAARWLIEIKATEMKDVKKIRGNISRAIDQKQRKTAFGYKWYSSLI